MSDFKQILSESSKVLVKCSASWCGPCKRIAPVFEQLSQSVSYPCVSVDVDEVEEVSDKFSIHGLPTFILLENSEEVTRVVGADEKKLRKIMNL